MLNLGLTQPPTFDYNESVFSQRQIFNVGASQDDVETANPSTVAGAPTALTAGASNNNANSDNASHDQIMGGSDENNGGGTGTPSARPPTPNPYNAGGGWIPKCSPTTVPCQAIQQVHKMLLLWIEHLYVEPRLKYDNQVAENEITTHYSYQESSKEPEDDGTSG